jgi:hypothetical protein
VLQTGRPIGFNTYSFLETTVFGILHATFLVGFRLFTFDATPPFPTLDLQRERGLFLSPLGLIFRMYFDLRRDISRHCAIASNFEINFVCDDVGNCLDQLHRVLVNDLGLEWCRWLIDDRHLSTTFVSADIIFLLVNSMIRVDAKWIVFRGKLKGHNDTPFEQPTLGRPIGRLGVGRPQGFIGGFSYY